MALFGRTQEAVDVGEPLCLICETPNVAEATVCANCFAPLSLTHEAVRQGKLPQLVSILGDSNVGKTVYLGMLLDMLSKRGANLEAVAKGVYSVQLQEHTVTYLSQRRFPPKTPSEPDQWHWAYYQINNGRKKQIDLAMPDLAGEALAAEMENPRTFQVIMSLLQKTAGCLLLIDAPRACDGTPQQDFFAVKLLSYFDQLSDTKPGKPVTRPVGIVLCKADRADDCFDDPDGFVKANLNRLWNLCQSRFSCAKFFACSVVGSLGYVTDGDGYRVDVPLFIEPRGILEPFQWMMQQL